MSTSSLIFRMPGSLGVIEFAPQVLDHFEKHKQLKLFSCEAGGQLFANQDEEGLIKVVEATGPRSSDKRSVFRYEPNRFVEQMEIKEAFSRGLDFIGDWHTHRQKIPVPSATDNASMRDMVRESKHTQPGFVMVIIGQAKFPDGLHVSFHTPWVAEKLRPI